ncbi:hypothetical protein [uncultured Maribacter sp.]|uniref:hypothetical protein n=1 Tax=uncultured Maribacter sp. TaxID=431308 RepID=UPI002638BFB3|nr:hypothetical protein [uncultured Maribacter sp.]
MSTYITKYARYLISNSTMLAQASIVILYTECITILSNGYSILNSNISIEILTFKKILSFIIYIAILKVIQPFLEILKSEFDFKKEIKLSNEAIITNFILLITLGIYIILTLNSPQLRLYSMNESLNNMCFLIIVAFFLGSLLCFIKSKIDREKNNN